MSLNFPNIPQFSTLVLSDITTFSHFTHELQTGNITCFLCTTQAQYSCTYPYTGNSKGRHLFISIICQPDKHTDYSAVTNAAVHSYFLFHSHICTFPLSFLHNSNWKIFLPRPRFSTKCNHDDDSNFYAFYDLIHICNY